MKNYENELSELNILLEVENFEIQQFEKIFFQLFSDKKLEIMLVDFEYYNEEFCLESRKAKELKMLNLDYQEAARFRDFEVKCEKHLKLKEELKIVKSEFYIENKTLFYLCLGNARNDSKIKAYFQNKEIE